MNKAKIFVCYPSLDGKPELDSMQTMIMHTMLSKLSTPLYYYAKGESLISRLRDIAFCDFLQTDCDYFLSIDSDLTILNDPTQNNVIDMLIQNDKWFNGGLYSVKKPMQFISASIPMDCTKELQFNSGLVEMKYLSSGFWFIKRKVIERMYEHYKNDYVDGEEKNIGKKIVLLCNPIVKETTYEGKSFRKLLSEDWTCCEKWLNMDEKNKIYANTNILLSHTGKFDNLLFIPKQEQPKETLPPVGFNLDMELKDLQYVNT